MRTLPGKLELWSIFFLVMNRFSTLISDIMLQPKKQDNTRANAHDGFRIQSFNAGYESTRCTLHHSFSKTAALSQPRTAARPYPPPPLDDAITATAHLIRRQWYSETHERAANSPRYVKLALHVE